MMVYDKINVKLRIDSNNQWFAVVVVKMGKRQAAVRFKIDTGCNALVLSHGTLERLGFSTENTNLLKLPGITGALASGDKHTFRKLGGVSLFLDDTRTIHICDAEAICHSTHETHDLMGTEVLRQFSGVMFNLVGSHMELVMPL